MLRGVRELVPELGKTRYGEGSRAVVGERINLNPYPKSFQIQSQSQNFQNSISIPNIRSYSKKSQKYTYEKRLKSEKKRQIL